MKTERVNITDITKRTGLSITTSNLNEDRNVLMCRFIDDLNDE